MPNAEARCIPAIAAEFSGRWGEKCQHQPVQPRKFPTHRGGLHFWSRFASWPRFIDEQALVAFRVDMVCGSMPALRDFEK